ncbi:glycosyltransferase family 4 protein [Ornithinimicrobium pratense]|uniref:Glycosyltransferase n=1 Tax=Ornithinimicrobium pratense TaxID=2593973 RepID=A0A5J6V974_9MICO|nr:glycosyltransferase [Ornithinimicrobium pratense]QFG69701.1 glycosyltransferase [Ornithinimicrobium pratense]
MTTVAYVCADPGIPVFGTKGASVHIQEIVRAWRARGAHVEVYAVRRGEDVPADLADLPVHIVRVGGKGLDPAEREHAQQRAAADLAGQVVELAPDVVYERYSLFSRVLGQVRDALPGREPTTILEVNAPLIEEQATHRVLVDVESAVGALRAQLAAADVVGCVSQPVADWVGGHLDNRADAAARTRHLDGGADAGAVTVCHIRRPDDGCDTPFWHTGAQRPTTAARPSIVVTPNGVNTARIRPVIPDLAGAPVVVFVGTLKPWHGVEDLVEAAALAQVPWRLRLIGDGPVREVVEAAVAKHGLDVELVGAVAPEQVPQALQGALVAVAPYPERDDHYFSPLKVYEYGAAALATVATRIGQIPSVVRDGETGVLVPPSDPAALAAAIDALVADPARAGRLGAAARELMDSEHSWDHVLDATLEAQGALV